MKQLASMSVDHLLNLRSNIDVELQHREKQIRKDLAVLGSSIHNSRGKGNGSHLKGIKLKPKYRGPKGETWAGRGQRPKWLVALVKQGRKLESYRVKN